MVRHLDQQICPENFRPNAPAVSGTRVINGFNSAYIRFPQAVQSTADTQLMLPDTISAGTNAGGLVCWLYWVPESDAVIGSVDWYIYAQTHTDGQLVTVGPQILGDNSNATVAGFRVWEFTISTRYQIPGGAMQSNSWMTLRVERAGTGGLATGADMVGFICQYRSKG